MSHRSKFYSSSSESSSTSSSSSDSSFEDSQLAVIRRLENALPEPSPTACSDMDKSPRSRRHKKGDRVDDSRDDYYKREMMTPAKTDLDCGSCPRGRAKKKNATSYGAPVPPTMTTTDRVPMPASFANLVLPETVPISAPSTALTMSRPALKTGLKLPETVPISATRGVQKADLGHDHYDDKEREHRRRHRKHEDPYWPFYAKPGDKALNAEARAFVAKNFPAQPVGQKTAKDTSMFTQLLCCQEKLEALVAQMKTVTAVKTVQAPLSAFPEMELSSHHHHHHHKQHHDKPRRSDAKGWGVPLSEPSDVSAVTTADYKARPITVSFPNSQLSALATRLAMAEKPGNESLRAVLLQGKLPNFASPLSEYPGSGATTTTTPTMKTDCVWSGDKVTVWKHLMKSHREFFHLLRDNELLPALEATQDLVLFIPDTETLADITNRVSAETATVLKYHAVVVPVDEPLRQVQGMTEYTTLAEGQVVQVEKRQDSFYVNGHVMKSDVVFPVQLYHIQGLLSPKQLVEEQPLPEPMMPDQGESTDTSGEEEAAAPEDENTTSATTTGGGEAAASTGEEPQDGTAVFLPVTATPLALKGFNSKKTVTLNSAVGAIASNMSRAFYSTPIDAKGYLDASYVHTAPVTLQLRTYNTDTLFEAYQQKKMRDLVRMRGEPIGAAAALGAAGGIVIAANQQRRLDIGNNQALTEFWLDSSAGAIKKADLLAGMTELTLNLGAERGQAVLKCMLQASETDSNTFLSSDESLLLRFNKNVLETVAVNLDKAVVAPTEAATQEGTHFLELFTTAEAREKLYQAAMNREAFNVMLLNESKITKYLKKKAHQAKRKLGKFSRYALDKGQKEAKKKMALRLKPVRRSAVPIQALEDFEKDATPMNASVTVMVYDKSMNLVQDQTMEFLAAQKFLYALEGEKFSGYVLPAEYGLGRGLGETKEGHYLAVKTQIETVWFNFSNVAVEPVGSAYWATKGSTLYVLLFDVNGNLVRMVNMLKHTKLIKGLAI